MNQAKSETLNFGGFPGYYNYMSYYQGYGGMNFFADFLYMNATTWTAPNGVGYLYGWCDTGYQNEVAMSGASSLGVIYQYGIMESASHHSFTLETMNAASSFDRHALWHVISYTEQGGSLVTKATDTLKVSYHGEQVNLASLGGPGDFKNIAAVAFQLVSYGRPGDKCTYGYPVVGPQLAIGDVALTWSKKADLPHGNGKLPTPYLLHHPAFAVPHLTASHHGVNSPTEHHQYHQDSAGHDPGISSQFHLPAIEHFF